MSLQTYLESLREQPVHVRKRYAFWTSFGVTAVIFMFWINSFSSFGVVPRSAVSVAVEKAGKPGESLVAGVGSFFNDLKDLIFGPKKINYSSVEVIPGKK